MDIEECSKSNLTCYKCHSPLMGAFNIDYNGNTSTLVLWNKYEIYVYENLIFERVSKIIVPDFTINQLLSTNNFILCLDFTGNIHITSMKFKNSAQKRIKSNFLPREQGVLTCASYTASTVLCLKSEQKSYYLSLHNFTFEFELLKKVTLTNFEVNHNPSILHNMIRIKCYTIPLEHYDNVTKIFNFKDTLWKDYSIILISTDRILYGCMFSIKMCGEELLLHKLLTSPSEICNLNIIESNNLYILVGLIAGTLIRLPLNDKITSDIVHLNTAISKCIYTNNKVFYTDGVSMWKSDNTFTEKIKFNQLIVKQIKDFVVIADQLLCTTFTNLIYSLMYEDDASYIKQSKDEYCEVSNVLNESGILYQILEQVEENNKLEKRINEESNYITALSLANRSDILNNVIKYSVFIFENYMDILGENVEITLTDSIVEYHRNNVFYFLVRIKLELAKDNFSNIFLQVFKDLKIHTTLLSANNLLKTVSIEINEMKNINICIPMCMQDVNSSVKVILNIIKGIPGALNEEKIFWIALHKKEMFLNAEHFIKTKLLNSNIVQLKETDNSLEDLVQQIANNNNEDLIKFTNILSQRRSEQWSYYVKIPYNHEVALRNESYLKELFCTEKAMFLLKIITSKEFLKTASKITFDIGNDKVNVEIVNDGFSNTNTLRVTSDNMKIGFDIRNFFHGLVYNNLKDCEPEKEFVRYTLYTTIENLQKTAKRIIQDQYDNEYMKEVLQQFHRDVFGAMPI